MGSNSVCNHTNDKQNRMSAKRECDLFVKSEWSTIQGVIGRVISDLKLQARLPLNFVTN